MAAQLDRVARVGDGGRGKAPKTKFVHETHRDVFVVIVRDTEWDLWSGQA